MVWRPLRSAPESNEGLYVAGLRSTIHWDQGSNLPDAVVTVAYHNHSTRFDRGEPVDVFLTDSAAIDELIKWGKVAPGRTDLARTAVRRGASKPDVSSPEALKRALLAAKSIAHTPPAGGGVTAAHVMGVLNRLGIAAEVTPKVKLAAGGPNRHVSVLVSSGEAEIGLQQVFDLISNPEFEVIGMLPAELQLTTIYSAGVTTSASEDEAAKPLIKALSAPSAAPIYKARGLDPHG
jgi:molybdate transport system substrate-binding protein